MNVVEVKGIKIGEGIPKICVPIVGGTNAELIEEAKSLKGIKLDLVEWRVDFYENVEDIEKVKEILKELVEVLGNTPVLFTFRSKKEGGEREVSTEYYVKLNCEIAKTKLIDLVDVELFTGNEFVNEVVETAHNNGVKVVMSNHDFFKTPAKEEIVSRLSKMTELNADLPKIAVMPQNEADVLTLLCATNEMKQKYPEKPIITMSMAGMGVISRLAGEFFGSVLTFGAAKKASAPGQIGVEDLYSVLQLLHRSK
ncbi:type I 3-dehydroquinate dehydratase [Clostridium saccharobutylicum]|uniref:3-dehydroquinate dehydratase n=1 Tax=Clostridium saccharobutylicum DSM 13864 TaxID=1345695 RepID=U5MNZ0_CLOSA|nr:type I 3-dehydroquinate dehydratase [Clostridium saccharobutylicum]AGX42494.1 3-dehydroquinate dehydratase AroD [Clostridium saccharobutylicum DSM 13864]AQR89779.1 3-dehydroquinate dehydratase [Clostridium saccharobutylicum]AQR99681.1 3-dehydroquinate dehydratase [Clostridium saccharobutylicum]AQS09411.1 3-dehydroquinate dehydratase [Clostridium saccharobutylicum]AQS13667.1 3-dehydroquinate dehydratase [Clostridium saccharobutylicum]